MSDPVKSVEIEDVLSSIRRLLADGEQQAPAPGPRPVDRSEQAAAAPARARSERRADAPLVLTPALRVAGRAEPPAAEAPSPAPSSAPSPAPFPPAAGRGAAEVPDDDFEAPDLPQAAPSQEPGLRSRLEATIAELESAITHQVEEWEPDGSEPAPVMDWASARAEDAPFLSRRHAHAQESAAQRMQAAPTEAPAPEARFHDGLAEETAPQADPAPEARAAATEAPIPAARVKAPVTESAAPSARPEAEQAPIVDEEMLRRIVTEVLREELRGPLGDRITSNLRKLVRREIFRALASGEVD